MKLSRTQAVFMLTVGFIFLILAIYLVINRIGYRYKQNIGSIELEPKGSETTHTEREKIAKIQIKKTDSDGCIEISPDGIVRVFKKCDEVLENAIREDDIRYISRLFKQISETNFEGTDDVSDCKTYIITIYQGLGIKNICLALGSGFSSKDGTGGSSGNTLKVIIDDIIKTIDLIISSVPTPTQIVTPSPYLNPSMSPTPTGVNISTTISPTSIISPTPTPLGYEKPPFLCDFEVKKGSKKPYTISGVVCSSEPTPVP